jgi:hypothetical protein
MSMMNASDGIALRVQSCARTMPPHEVGEATHHRMLIASRLPKIVLRLHVHPKFRRSAKRGCKSESHIGGDACLAIQQSRQSYTRCVKVRGGHGDGHFPEVLAKNQAGMGRIVHC